MYIYVMGKGGDTMKDWRKYYEKPLVEYETDDEYATYLCGDPQRVEDLRARGFDPLTEILEELGMEDDRKTYERFDETAYEV